MKKGRCHLPLRSRLAVWRSLSITLITLLSLPSAGFANLRGGSPLRTASSNTTVAARAPLAAAIEVNTTGDGDNLYRHRSAGTTNSLRPIRPDSQPDGRCRRCQPWRRECPTGAELEHARADARHRSGPPAHSALVPQLAEPGGVAH